MKTDLNAVVSKKTAIISVISIVAFVIIAMIGAAAGNTAYENNTKTEIANAENFTMTAPKIYVYGYPDNKTSVDISEILEVSKNASFKVLSVKEKLSDTQYNVVDKTGATVIKVADKVAKYVTVEIANRHKSSQYMLILVAKSNEANTILAHNTTMDGTFFDFYNSGQDYILPTPQKSYTSDIASYSYQFEGWYTSAEFAEGTEIEYIPAGTSGVFELYAKFKSTSRALGDDGIEYYVMGEYPQGRVTNYAHLGVLRNDAAAALSEGANGIFTSSVGDGTTSQKYYRFRPPNAVNVAANGYSPSSYYFFYIEPIEWMILTTGTVSSGQKYTIMTRKILNCSTFIDRSAQSIFESLGIDYEDNFLSGILDTFLESIYGPESLWWRSGARAITKEMYASGNPWLTSAELNTIQGREYTAYYTDINISLSDFKLSPVPSKKIMSDTNGDATEPAEKIYLLQYSDMSNTNYGFSSDLLGYDSAKRAQVSDYAKANGAYSVTNERYKNVGTYFLRGAGSTYDKSHKRFAYVKYSGAVHCYTTTTWKIRSGIRPACVATVSF